MRSILSRALSLILLTLALGPVAHLQAEERILFDFEQADLKTSWRGVGQIQAARGAAPAAPAGQGTLPAGSALELQASPDSAIATLSGKVPGDWRRFSEFSCWAYRSPEEVKRAPKAIVEIHLLEAGGRARFWRRIELTQAGWSRTAIPLKWFRQGEGRVPRWDRIDQLAFRFRDQGTLQLDAIGVTTGADDESSQLSEKDLREVAFPGVAPAAIRSASPAEFLLLTNAPDLDINKLAEHLKKVATAVRADLPFLADGPGKPVLIVFATREEYQQFTVRLAERLGAQSAPPKSGGYTLQGIATSSWDAELGTLRPVFTHEFVHSLLDRKGLLPNAGEWLQEGLATRFQIQFHPQADLGKIILRGLEDPNLRLPMETLANGKRIPLDRYWQAMSLSDFLLTEERYRKQAPEIFAEFLKRGDTDLNPHFGKLIEADVAKFTGEWAVWCRGKYR